MAMEIGSTEGLLLDLLKAASEEGLMYNSSQISEGFGRMVDGVVDLLLDIPNARRILQSVISKAASQGWLCASSLKSLVSTPVKGSLQDDSTKIYKLEAQSIIREYFLSGDISEVGSCLESENSGCSTADDAALDNLGVVEDLAMFLAIAVVDEIQEPQHSEEIGTQFMGPKSIGRKILQKFKWQSQELSSKMTRRKIEIKRIQNEDYRKVTYSKRRAGLIKKAKLLSSRSNTQIAIISCSLSGRHFTFGHPSVDSVVDQFLENYTIDSRGSSSDESSHDNTHGPSSSSKGVVDGKEGRRSNSWWALPIEDMDLDMDGLRQYKASLEILRSNVASRLKEMEERSSLARDFIGLLDDH
ncbi:hypothetical protein SADUNF_Sadunf02G0051700 [Salix dunnii]|uniref:MADS-box domain-containing protein n=1 Tax=Salix dunnii TaxID=1413687 RepID=A0A835TIN1_9ROSI|nr:hypothetical protein SADUNF_Sadunf02G0051700 [Salix dunnii]